MNSSKIITTLFVITLAVLFTSTPVHADTLWSTSGTDISNTNAGNVGIGTAPSGNYLFEVNGSIGATDLNLSNLGGAGNQCLRVDDNGNITRTGSDCASLSGIVSSQWTTSGSNIYFSTGKIGLGAQASSLGNYDINDTFNSGTNGIRIGQSNGTTNQRTLDVLLNLTGSYGLIEAHGDAGIPLILNGSNGGKVGIGTTSPWALLSISPSYNNGSSPLLVVGSSSVAKLIVQSNGNVGIGTSTPSQALDVNGNVNLNGNIVSDGDICIGKCQ